MGLAAGETTPAFEAGVVGEAVKVSLDAGQTVVLRAFDSDELDLATSWTVEAFVKPDVISSKQWERLATKWFDGSTE